VEEVRVEQTLAAAPRFENPIPWTGLLWMGRLWAGLLSGALIGRRTKGAGRGQGPVSGMAARPGQVRAPPAMARPGPGLCPPPAKGGGSPSSAPF